MRKIKLLLFVALLCLWPAVCFAEGEDLLLDREDEKQFFLTITGQVGKNNFGPIKGMMRLAYTSLGAVNPYMVIIVGYPRDNMPDSFFWNSDHTRMRADPTTIECNVVEGVVKKPDVFFYYLSPTLLEVKGFRTQGDKDTVAQAKKRALPTRVYAQAGNLKLTVMGSRVTGTVWLSGYDEIQHAYVKYTARLEGQLSQHLKSTHRVWKYD